MLLCKWKFTTSCECFKNTQSFSCCGVCLHGSEYIIPHTPWLLGSNENKVLFILILGAFCSSMAVEKNEKYLSSISEKSQLSHNYCHLVPLATTQSEALQYVGEQLVKKATQASSSSNIMIHFMINFSLGLSMLHSLLRFLHLCSYGSYDSSDQQCHVRHSIINTQGMNTV